MILANIGPSHIDTLLQRIVVTMSSIPFHPKGVTSFIDVPKIKLKFFQLILWLHKDLSKRKLDVINYLVLESQVGGQVAHTLDNLVELFLQYLREKRKISPGKSE